MSNLFGQPPAKQAFSQNIQGGGPAPSFSLQPSELDGPDEPESTTNYDPMEMARMHFLIHCNKMLTSFAKAFPSCPSTQIAKNHLASTFPRLPVKIDHNSHAEMQYPLNDKQKEQVTGWIKQFYQVMTHKVNFKGREFQVSQYFQHRKPEAWGFVIKHVKMIGMLHLEQKWPKMSQSSQNSMWRYMDLLYRDAQQFMGFSNFEKFIPKQMRDQMEAIMAKSTANSSEFTPEDAQRVFKDMTSNPEMIQGLVSNVFSNPEQTKQMFQSVSDVTGGNLGQLSGIMQNMFK